MWLGEIQRKGLFLQDYLSQIKELSDVVHFHFIFRGKRSQNFQYSSVIHRQQIDIKIKECIFIDGTDNVSDHRVLETLLL